MKPLRPITCYIAVSVKDELPKAGVMVSVSMDDGKTFPYEAKYKPIFKNELDWTHWLKEASVYAFTKEELVEFIKNNWGACMNRVMWEDLPEDDEVKLTYRKLHGDKPTQSEYIKELLP